MDFDPDLIVFVAPTDKADIIMRATSYCTGDFYEFKSTNVLGCHWLYNYPYMTGKVNMMITGMHFGMKRAKLYPMGLHVIVVPYQKLQNFFVGLEEMEWELIPCKEDEESKAIVAKGYEKFTAAHDIDFLVDPNERVRHV